MIVEITYAKDSTFRSGSVTKTAVRHGIKTEMPFIDKVVIKTIKEERWYKEQRKQSMNVIGKRKNNKRWK